MKIKMFIPFLLVIYVSEVIAQEKPAQSAEELAKKLANPVANLISFPLQNNTDYGIGQYNGSKNTLNIQPVIPIQLSPKLNLITRFILPLISQRDISGPDTKQTGLSDLSATAFFAPSDTKHGLIWGLGPAFLIPTGNKENL